MTEDGAAPRPGGAFEGGHEAASACAYCPLCASIAVLRARRPEILNHLAAAARELMAAAAVVLEEAQEAVAEPENATPPRRSGVRRIEVS